MITESTLDDIADAIREKNGEGFLYYPNEMPAAVRRIPTGGGGSGSVVAVFPVLLSGEHIADIVVDGDTFALYAPEPIEYQEGTGITISNGVVSLSDAVQATLAGKVDTTTFTTAIANLVASVASKQDILSAGQGITITGNTISADGTDVEANPSGTPTDQLTTIKIGSDIYEIVGGGGSGTVDTLFETTSAVSPMNLTDSIFDYDSIFVAISDANGYTRGMSYAPSELTTGQVIGFDNTYGYTWNTITSGTVLTNTAQSNFFISSVVGVKGGGGGSSTGAEELTQTQYNSLTPSQKNDGTIYFIKKDSGGGTYVEQKSLTFLNALTPFNVGENFVSAEGIFTHDSSYGVLMSVNGNQGSASRTHNGVVEYTSNNCTYENGVFTFDAYFVQNYCGASTVDFDCTYNNPAYVGDKIYYMDKTYGAGGGASAVSDLTDVDLTNLSNGQVLKYNSTSQKWENANESGGTTLPFDVVINSTDNGIDIVYET